MTTVAVAGPTGGPPPRRSQRAPNDQHELDHAADRYGTYRFFAADNFMEMSYLRTLLPTLVEDDAGYELFYELEANLTRDQVELLRRAGVRRAQAGVESLSSHVLGLMDKGVTGIQNINLLRWARHYGVSLLWNMLYAIPGETAQDYRRLDATIPHPLHLQPPRAFCATDMERFSPMFDEPDRFPVRYRRPRATYRHVYPRSVDLEKVAYTFDHEFEQSLPDTEYEPTRRLLAAWHEAWRQPMPPSLTFGWADAALVITDLRDHARPTAFTVTEPLASLYAALSDRPRGVARVATELRIVEPVEELTAAMDEFCARGLMVREGTAFLSLALPSRWTN